MYNGANAMGDDPRIKSTEPDGRDPAEPLEEFGHASFAEYLQHAERSRAYENELHGNGGSTGLFRRRKGADAGAVANADSPSDEKVHDEKGVPIEGVALTAEQREYLNARRALRSASWAAVFYLITTDILGPFNAPFAFSQVGFVPGVILYLVMGVMAGYTGLLLWYLFLRLDSDVYPVKTYADLARRIFGNWAAHICSILQSLQLIVNVGTIILSNGQSVSQISKGKLCFAVCIVIWAFVGMFVGQIRSLKNYGWLANSAVWLNLLLIFITMGVVAHSPPNFAGAKAAFNLDPGPVHTSAFVSLPLSSKVNGIMNMVFAYGGAMIFPEMLAEMRRPWDFWKGMVAAQLLIFCAYMMFGLFVYSFQGQFTLGLAYQGMSKFAWQTVGNVIALITGIIAAGLYGNIGIKVAYYSIIEGMLKGPRLQSPRGRIIWTIMVVVYWSLAFIVGSAIPQVQTISGLVAAVCIMQFTYTFPPVLVWGYLMRRDRLNPPTHFSAKMFVFKWFNFILFLASAAMACLGMFGSGTAIKDTFKSSQATSFGCKPPV